MYDVDVRYALHDIVMDLARSCYHDCDDALRSRGFKSRVISKNPQSWIKSKTRLSSSTIDFIYVQNPRPSKGSFSDQSDYRLVL